MNVLIFSFIIGLLQIVSSHLPALHADTSVPPITGFANCYEGRHALVTLDSRDLLSEGPTCAPASSRNPSASSGEEPLLIFPINEEGTLEEKPCVAITTPQTYCDIPSGSLLSAFPLV
jgi:hypothetical protein